MVRNRLTSSMLQRDRATSPHDHIQIALAIAEENVLKSLLVNCSPPIVDYHRLGSVSASIGVPATSKKAVDGIIQFEEINCVLADAAVETDPHLAEVNMGNAPRYRHLSLVRCESEMHTLGQTLSLSQAIALLARSGFSPQQIEDILNLPHEAWHKTWWYTLDEDGNFTIPFLRTLRTLRYTDGSFTIQYKDHYSQEKPPCFSAREEKVLIEIKPEVQSFSRTLEKINHSREECSINRAILICDQLSPLEAQGFMSQGISVYTGAELDIPIQANCLACTNHGCPMNGYTDSPVMMCRQFVFDQPDF